MLFKKKVQEPMTEVRGFTENEMHKMGVIGQVMAERPGGPSTDVVVL